VAFGHRQHSPRVLQSRQSVPVLVGGQRDRLEAADQIIADAQQAARLPKSVKNWLAPDRSGHQSAAAPERTCHAMPTVAHSLKPYRQTRAEQETIIRWDREDSQVDLFSASPVVWPKR
jgi:hypothetical protein